MGERLGESVPKALVKAGGKPLLEWCLEALGAADSIGAVVVAVPEGWDQGIEGDARVVVGGPSRSEYVALAMEHVESEEVVIHDAARPLAEPALFDAVIQRLRDEDADGVVAAAPMTDTIKEVLRSGEVDRTLDRSRLWAVQTPQAFKTESLRKALASTEVIAQATDEAMLVERIGGKVVVHEAPRENIKVTTPLDLRLAELLLADRNG